MLLDMIDRDPMEIEQQQPARIPAQREAAALTHQRAGFVDALADIHPCRIGDWRSGASEER